MPSETLIRPGKDTVVATVHYASFAPSISTRGTRPSIFMPTLSQHEAAIFGTRALMLSFRGGQVDIAEGRARAFDNVEDLITDLRS